MDFDFETPYTTSSERGSLRIGWASWDDGSLRERSIKYAYLNESGKISRGCPELPFDILVDMLLLAIKQNELSPEDLEKIRKAIL